MKKTFLFILLLLAMSCSTPEKEIKEMYIKIDSLKSHFPGAKIYATEKQYLVQDTDGVMYEVLFINDSQVIASEINMYE